MKVPARARTSLAVVAIAAGAVALGQLLGPLFGHGRVPMSVELGLGGVTGCQSALLAVGIVLVYQMNRVINFSQASFGTAAAAMFVILKGVQGWSYWFALPAAIGTAIVLGAAAEIFIVRRFTRSPRVVLTLVTIVGSQILASFAILLPTMFRFNFAQLQGGSFSRPLSTPFSHFKIDWFPLVFTGDHLVLVAATFVIMAALAGFLRFTRMGVAVRGAAVNRDRIEQLGVNIRLLSTSVWVIMAVLGAVGTVFAITASQDSVSSFFGSGGGAIDVASFTLLEALAAAVIARMQSIPIAFASALAISVLNQAALWIFQDSSLVEVALFVVILGVLLLQKAESSRADDAASFGGESSEEIRPIPHELASIPVVRDGVRRFLWVLAFVVLAYPWVMSPGQTRLGATYAIYGMVGISLVVLTGWTGQISLGQFAFVAVGAVVGGAATGRWGLPFLVGLVLGSVVAAAVAVIAGLPALRIRGLYLAVTSLALAIAVSDFVINPKYFGWLLPSSVPRPDFIVNTNLGERSYYYLCVAILAGFIALTTWLRRGRLGRLLIAVRDNERTAQSFGIDLVRAKLLAFATAGGLAGAAGVLFATQQRAVSPGSYSADMSIQMFLMAILGGLGSPFTVLVGAIYLGTTEILIPNLGGQLLASGFGVMAILIFFPKGLGALVFRGRDAWLRRVALRLRIFVPSLAGSKVKRGEQALVRLAPRLADLDPVPSDYRIDSTIGETGASQLEKVWRY